MKWTVAIVAVVVSVTGAVRGPDPATCSWVPSNFFFGEKARGPQPALAPPARTMPPRGGGRWPIATSIDRLQALMLKSTVDRSAVRGYARGYRADIALRP
jgi:hypothetical protein